MAISTSFLLSTTASANNTSTVVATTSLPQNCHTVIIYNPDGTNDVYVAVGAASGSALSVASSTVIPAGGSLTLGIGPETFRPTSTDDLAFSTSAGTIAVNISYICSNKV
jgi:hypothetical protein